jgi:hypothetical protein
MATLKGVVTDAGTPVNAAQVSVFPTGTTNLKGQDTSGPGDGSYSISKLESGATYDVTVTDSSGADLHTFSVTMGASTTTTVDLDVSVASTTSSTATSATTTTTGTSATSATSETSATSATSETSATSATSETSATSVTSVTTATTATETSSSTTTSGSSTVTSATTITLAPDPAFQSLKALVSSPDFSITAAVNLDEARQCANLFTIGNYLLARVPESIANLNNMLTNNTEGRLNLVNKAGLIQNFNAKIESVLTRRAEDFNNEASVLREVRRQFNLGTEPAPDVNRNFPALFKEFVGLCADDLMGVTPDQVEGTSGGFVFDPAEKEKLYNFLRRLKASIINLTESMSVAGTLGTQALVHRWAGILSDSLDIVNNVSKNHVATDDNDQRHWVATVVALNNGQTADIKPYLVHAREGGQLLDDTITAYDAIRQQNALEIEDEGFLKSFFHTAGNVFPNIAAPAPASTSTTGTGASTAAAPAVAGVTVVVKLKQNARLLRDNWPTNWS